MTTSPVTAQESPPARTADPVVTVAVNDDHVAFTGLANVHRYDQPTANEIASYIRSLLGDNPQWAPVHLIAEEDTLEQLIQAFSDYEVELTCEVPEDEPDQVPRDANTVTHPATSTWENIGHISVQRPVLEPRRKDRFGASGYALVGVVAVVAVVCGVAIWSVAGRGSGSEDQAALDAESDDTAEPMPGEAPADPLPAVEEIEPSDTPAAPHMEKVTLEQDGLSVELPVGFRLEPDGDMWRATGQDPDFRLQLAVDPLYGVDPEAVMRQVRKDIDADPELHHIDSDEHSIHYEHHLPDGSQAQWSTWTDRDVQISIGCHTRTTPSTVQLATCTMANESARFSPG